MKIKTISYGKAIDSKVRELLEHQFKQLLAANVMDWLWNDLPGQALHRVQKYKLKRHVTGYLRKSGANSIKTVENASNIKWKFKLKKEYFHKHNISEIIRDITVTITLQLDGDN